MRQAQPSALTDLGTMLWLDYRGTVNAFARIHREPLRAAGWLLWIAFFGWKLFLQPRGALHAMPSVDGTIDVAASMLLLVASLSLVRGEHPAIAFFASPLEARWMSGSHLRPWISIPYLQLRNVFERLPSFAIFLVYILAYCLPPVHSYVAFALGVFNVAALTLCSRMFSLPRELAPLWARIPLIGIGLLAGAYAVVAGFEAFAGLLAINPPILHLLPALHPGLAFIYGARGDVRVSAVAAALLLSCVVSLVILCRDRFPELYEISRAGWEVRRRFRDGRMHMEAAAANDELGAGALKRVPSGAAVLLWTNWQMYRRQNWRYWPVLRLPAALAFGATLAALHVAPETLGSTIGVVFGLTTTFSSLIDSARIGMTIRHPLFWLTEESFTFRLTVVVFSWYWRSALDIVFFAGGAVCGGTALPLALSTAAILVTGIWLQRCVGLAAFAILPSRADIGGPTALARFALALMLAIPPVVAAIIIAQVGHSPVVGYGAGCVLALIEAQVLIYLSARLLDGRFDKILAA